LSYVLPLIYWGVIGLALYYLERSEKEPEELSEFDDYEEIQEEERRELTVRI
jgi:hypothetical protein